MSLAAHYRLTICIRSDDTIRPNTNALFRPLFSTEVNMKQIFGTSLISYNILLLYLITIILRGKCAFLWIAWKFDYHRTCWMLAAVYLLW